MGWRQGDGGPRGAGDVLSPVGWGAGCVQFMKTDRATHSHTFLWAGVCYT